MPQQKNLTFTRSAENGHCAECGARTCMRAIVRDNQYPYVHKVFECAKCTKSKANSLEQGEIARLDVGDAYTNGEKIVRVDDIFEDIIFCSVFEAQQPYACLDMVAKSANDVIDELNSANAQKWTPPEGYKVAMPLKNFAEREK